jgi:hypothetical protein
MLSGFPERSNQMQAKAIESAMPIAQLLHSEGINHTLFPNRKKKAPAAVKQISGSANASLKAIYRFHITHFTDICFIFFDLRVNIQEL